MADADRNLVPRCAASVIIIVALALAIPLRSFALFGNVEGTAGLDASLRSTVLGIGNYDQPLLFGDHEWDVASQTVLRVVVAGHPSESCKYELHAVQMLEQSTAAAGVTTDLAPFARVAHRESRYRAFDLTWLQDDRGEWRSSLEADRANATMSFGSIDVTAGRQAITFGQTFFWSPLDVFSPFGALQFDRDYKAGVDALRVDTEFGALTGLTLVAAAGRTVDATGDVQQNGFLDASWTGSAVLARLFTSLAGWDLDFQAGKIFGGWQTGLGATGDLHGVDVRLEATALLEDSSPPLVLNSRMPTPDQVENAASVVLGIGRRFENTLDLHAEYFFNGGGDDNDLATSLARVSGGTLLAASRHLIGATAAYDLLPILVGRVSWTVSLEDGSGQIQPGITWSAANNIEVLLGAIISYGDHPRTLASDALEFRSEYGAYPSVLYLEPKVYF